MDSVFKMDGPLMRVLTKIGNLMLVSFLWCMACLPLITVVPASAAMFHTTTKVIRGNGNGVLKDFFRTFRREWKQGIALSLICVAAGLLLYTCLDFGWQMRASVGGAIYLLVGCLMAVFLASAMLYVPPVLSRFRGSVGVILRLSLYLASGRLLRTLGMLALLAVVGFFVDFYPLFLMFAPGVYTDLVCTGMEKALRGYADAAGLSEGEGVSAVEEMPQAPPEPTALEIAVQMEER